VGRNGLNRAGRDANAVYVASRTRADHDQLKLNGIARRVPSGRGHSVSCPPQFLPFYPTRPASPIPRRTPSCRQPRGPRRPQTALTLGVAVTVFDNSPRQLGRDREVAAREELAIRTVLGDMRDLSVFPDASFDVVFNPVSNVFCPDLAPVWRESFRVLRPGGILMAGFMNPDIFIFDITALEERGELVVRHRLPFTTLNLPDAERQRSYGTGADRVQPLAHGADRRPARRGLHPYSPGRSPAPRGRHGPVHAWLPRHPRHQAVTARSPGARIAHRRSSAGAGRLSPPWSIPGRPHRFELSF